jgi:His-Xaa-Ser system radical SAM maturase HxsC
MDYLASCKGDTDGMKAVKLQVTNINEPIICKVITEANFGDSQNKSFIFKYKKDYEEKIGYIIGSEKIFRTINSYPAALMENQNIFAVNDVFTIEPSGLCTLLIEGKSDKNALFITSECNCRCLLCPQPPCKSEGLLRQNLEILDLLEDDIEMLGITGGEPTVAWDELVKILYACNNRLPNTTIQLLTNARVLKSFECVKEIKAANSRLITSITLYSDNDSCHDSTVCAKGAFWETLKGIYNLAKADIPVEIRTVITRHNFQRLREFCEFIYNYLPFSCNIALMGLEPVGFALDNLGSLWVDPADYTENLEEAVKTLHRRNCNVLIYNHQLCTLSPFLRKFAVKSISEWKVFYLKECLKCGVSNDCGGLFESASDHHSRAIRAFQ